MSSKDSLHICEYLLTETVKKTLLPLFYSMKTLKPLSSMAQKCSSLASELPSFPSLVMLQADVEIS